MELFLQVSSWSTLNMALLRREPRIRSKTGMCWIKQPHENSSPGKNHASMKESINTQDAYYCLIYNNLYLEKLNMNT